MKSSSNKPDSWWVIVRELVIKPSRECDPSEALREFVARGGLRIQSKPEDARDDENGL